MARTLPTTVLLALLAAAPAAASTGGVQSPAHGGAGAGELRAPDQSASKEPASAEQAPKPKKKRKKKAKGSRANPLLSSFSVASSRLYIFGQKARVSFQIDGRSPEVRVRLRVAHVATKKRLRTIDLGMRDTGVTHVYGLSGREGGRLPNGLYRVRVVARDAAGRGLVRRARTSATQEISVYSHRFPLPGNFPYGDPGSRFGAPRGTHSHQGQDIAAPEGTPLLAPRGGRVKVIAYQASGAGHYVVIKGAGEKRDYVFMHLQDGSIRVRQGQFVRTGERIASVGNTGRSFGAHLHFEIWQGAWWGGGKPIDPYPHLRRWQSWS